MREKLKSVFSDSLWSIAGLMLMNVVAQFAVYPIWSRQLGETAYGDILYLISLMNILAVSVGSSCNYTRIMATVNGKTSNTPYTMFMLIISILMVPMALLISQFGGVPMTPLETATFALLMCATMWRYYADVEFRMELNYKGCFFYYAIISFGYGVGICLFVFCHAPWPMALLPGELLGIISVLLRGHILPFDGSCTVSQFWKVARPLLTLLTSEIISTLIFNGDRILLKAILGGATVTTYYLASLLGKTVSLISTPLNSVLAGYLARYHGRLNVRVMTGITIGASVLAGVGTLVCTAASFLLLPVLYPNEVAMASPFFVMANFAQVLYFITNVITVVLLRFSDTKVQVVINVEYGTLFCLLCIPFTLVEGLMGFCIGLLLANLVRFVTAVAFGYHTALYGKR